MKKGIITVSFLLSLSEVMDLENFRGDNFDFTTVPCAQKVLVSQHFSPLKVDTPVLCSFFSKSE